MEKNLLKMKEELKELAKRIKNGKSGRKPRFRNKGNRNHWEYLYIHRYKFRHMHIAYCMIRGRSRDQIEVPREGNLPSDEYIESIIEGYHEVVRAGQKRLAA